jgi:two-component system NtrC family response regulator
MPTVLVVDDEHLIRWSLGQQLAASGYGVREAADGAEALRLFEGADGPRPSLVLLDLKLPDLDGLELLRRMKRARPDCPVIMMTAHGTPETASEALQEGAFRILYKPFNQAFLMDLVRKALEPAPPPAP